MMEYPRKLSDYRGGVRWQGASGRTFATREEAESDTAVDIIDPGSGDAIGTTPKPEKSIVADWLGALFQAAFGGWVSVSSVYYGLTGQIHLQADWMYFLIPVGAFLMFGVALQGIAEIRSLLKGERGSIKPNSISDWWINRVGCGLIIFCAVVIFAIIAAAAVGNLFDGVSKGTTMIVVLLFCIFLALVNIGSRAR